jgi:glycosyltransferase involved in cell wall biosynthesis
MEDIPKVTVCCSTYNHGKFIRETLEGFVMQKTNFPYEVIIHDDASTDETPKIIAEYSKKFPNLIKTIIQRKNLYGEGMLNGTLYGFEPFMHNIFPIAKGKYLALCEGDDHWTDPEKLQKQFDFLENHPECVMCYHACVIRTEEGRLQTYGKKGKNFSGKQMASMPAGIATATKMLRNLYNEKTKEDFLAFSGDCLFTAYLGNYGRCDYVPGIKPSVYQIHQKGVWSGKTEEQKREVLNNLRELQCFYKEVSRKMITDNQTFGIVIPTYHRGDGKTSYYLKRALASIFSQTYTNFKIYVIGDKYEPEEELLDILSLYPKDVVKWNNLPRAYEREKYINNSEALWCSGGVYATNYGIDKAIADGIRYVCLIDHDDCWRSMHLHVLNKAIQSTRAVWLCTKASLNEEASKFLPKKVQSTIISDFLPIPRGLIKSSVCFDAQTIPIRARDVFAETGNTCPGDADMWERSAIFIKGKRLKSCYINIHTCIHDTEQYVRKGGCVERVVDKNDITVITCTGDRPEAFNLLCKWMDRQTIKPKQWIVIDDGKAPIIERKDMQYIRRIPSNKDPSHTLCINMMLALKEVLCDKIIIMEDDDWYSPTYIDYMSNLLDKADLVGFGNLIFYYPKTSKYMEKGTVKQPALGQTAFRKIIVPIIENICDNFTKDYNLCGKGLIDSKLWTSPLNIYKEEKCVRLTNSLKMANGKIVTTGTIFYPPIPSGILRRAVKNNGAEFINKRSIRTATKIIVMCDQYLSVGMKGMPGRVGLTSHHNIDNKKYKKDEDSKLLKSILKSDADFYLGIFP